MPPQPPINVVKVFTATKANDRDRLGERFTEWLRANADLQIINLEVMQSSDASFHCLSLVLFAHRPAA